MPIPADALLHLTDRASWTEARTTGRIAPPGLDADGFVHCSTPAQIGRVATTFYAGRTDLVLLVLHPDRLGSPLVWEGPVDPRTGRPEVVTPAHGGARFPHVYGPIDVAAVLEALPWAPDHDGVFRLPA